MKSPLIAVKKGRYLALAFAVPATMMLCLMISVGCTPFGQKSFLYSDSWHQYFPFFKAFREALRSGDSLLFNWDVGMGLDYLGLISYYLASPLNLLSVLLPESWVLPYFSMLIPIKLGLASLFFAIFLKGVFKKNDYSIALFGGFYGLCAWALGYQWNIMWLDTFALLPLVALGVFKLLREKKYALYTISLALAVVINYYIGFFVCIFVLLVFICYQISECKSWKRLLEDFIRIGLFTVLALGMTAILTLPAWSALKNTYSSVNSYPDSFSLNITPYADCAAARDAWKAYDRAVAAGQFAIGEWFTAIKESIGPIFSGMKQVAGNLSGGVEHTFKEGLPNVYSGVVTVLLSMLYLTCSKIKRRERLCALGLLLFLTLSFVIRQLDYIWHGFHFPNMIPYRFSFLCSFVLLFMAYRAYTMRKEFKVFQVIAAGALTVVVLFQSSVTAAIPGAMNALGEIISLSWRSTVAGFSGDWVAQQSAKESLDALYKTHGDAYLYLIFNVVFLLIYTILFLYPVLCRQLQENAEKSKKSTGKNKGKQQKNNKKPKKMTEEEQKKARQKERWKALLAPPKIASAVIAVVMVLELVLNVTNFGDHFSYTTITDYPQGKEYTASMIRYMKEREDELFYRAEVTHSKTLNDAALNSYHGISTFTSSANVRVTEFMQTIGYGAKNNYNRYCFEESSPVANLFLNLKYMIERDGRVEENSYFTTVHSYGNVYLQENKAYLPLGFLAESELAELDFSEMTGIPPFTLQNQMFTAATGVEDLVWRTQSGADIKITGENVSISSSTISGYCSYEAKSSGKLIYRFEILEEGFLCLDLTMPSRNSFSIYHNGQYLYNESLTLPQTLAVCDVKPGDVVEVKVTCKANENSTMTIRGAVMDDEVFWQGYEVLAASTLQLTEFSNAKIKGTISCNRDGLLYTSIPYDGNWKATVDGKDAEIRLVGDAMIALDLTEGEHEIVFTYENKSFTLGTVITVVCLLAFLGIVYWDNREKINKKVRKGWQKVRKLTRKESA